MLSGVPKCKQDVMCLTKKMHAVDKLHPGMSYCAVGCEFDVKESTNIVNKLSLKQKHTENKVMY